MGPSRRSGVRKTRVERAETIAVSREFRKVWVLDQDEDFMAYVSHFLKVEEPDAYAYMRMAIVSGRGSETLKLLRDASTELAEPYGAIIGSLVKYVGELKSENLKAIEAGLRKMIEHNKTPAAAAAEPEKSAPPVDDDDGWS